MLFGYDISFLGTSAKVFFIDLLLSGDNAVVIALASRALPQGQRRRIILIGAAAAIFCRVYLTTVVAYLLEVPCLKIIGGVALIVIAIRLVVDEGNRSAGSKDGNAEGGKALGMRGAVFAIVVADLIMSFDNVVALAAVAKGSVFVLALGLVFSIPLLMFGSMFVAALMNRYPALIVAGGALLGWIAGDIGASDPLVSDWIAVQAPALAVAMPLLGALFVYLESLVVQTDRRRAGAGRIDQSRSNLERSDRDGKANRPVDQISPADRLSPIVSTVRVNSFVTEANRQPEPNIGAGAMAAEANERAVSWLDLAGSLVRPVVRAVVRFARSGRESTVGFVLIALAAFAVGGGLTSPIWLMMSGEPPLAAMSNGLPIVVMTIIGIVVAVGLGLIAQRLRNPAEGSDRSSRPGDAKIAGGQNEGQELVSAPGRRAFAQRGATVRTVRTQPAYRPPSLDEASSVGALIVLAEDNPVDQLAIKDALERLGYAVESANDGLDACAILARRHCGLLITDIVMPRMDGFQLTIRIRTEERTTDRHLPIIGLAGYVAPTAMRQKCIDAGMDDCVGKPLSPERLQSIVKQWLPSADGLRRATAGVSHE